MEYREFVQEYVTAYEHRGGIKVLRLGRLDQQWFQEIQRDCAWIYANAGSSDVTAPDHVTNWTRPTGQVRQFSLFNSNGSSDDTSGDYGHLGDVRRKRLVFPELKGLSRFAALFGAGLRNLRLNGMGIGAGLSQHEEGSISAARFGPVYILRFHLPVFSNDQARVILDGEAFSFAEGELYFFHHGCVHAASNEGTVPRYHLVLDCYLDHALFRRLFPGSASPDPGFAKCSDSEARMGGSPVAVSSFVCEGGMVRNSLGYGRRAPGMFAYYRKNYPSLFRFLPAPA